MVAAIYARVSTSEQFVEGQLPELHAYADRNGWEAIEYLEEASGKEAAKRPALAKLLRDAKARKFQVVLCWKMDRFGRSVKDFIRNVEILDAAGIRFITITQPIDTDQRSPIGKLIMIILMAVAEFERDLIVERVRLGVKRYARDFESGQVGRTVQSKSGKNKPHGKPRKVFDRDLVQNLRTQGMSWRKIAKQVKVKESTLRVSMKTFA